MRSSKLDELTAVNRAKRRDSRRGNGWITDPTEEAKSILRFVVLVTLAKI
jgi:hypothetical protein